MQGRTPAWQRAPLLLCAVFLAGCGLLRQPSLHTPPAQLPTARELLANLAQRRERLHSLRALARLHYEDPRESGATRQALIVERPDRVRVEVLSLLGTAFLLTANDQSLLAYAPGERTVYRGNPSPQNLWRYTRLWMPVSDLVDIVLATPRIGTSGAGEVSFDAQSGDVQLHIRDALLSFSESQLPTGVERRDPSGEILWQARYSSYEQVDGVAVAKQIALELPRFERRMQLTLSEVELNPALADRWFALQTPPGSRVVDLDQMVD